MMEWPSKADGIWDPWILVPSHLETEQKELEPLQHAGVGRVEEAGPGLPGPGTMWQWKSTELIFWSAQGKLSLYLSFQE